MSEQTDTQPTVNPLGFSEWSSETNFDDPLESRVKYGDYLREQYINADAYTPTVEKEISIAFAQSLQQEGLLTEENASDVERRVSAIQGAVSFDQEARNMHRSLSSTEDAQTLSDYLSAADVDAPSPEYLEELQPLKDKATEIVNNEKDARARAMIDAGEIPMAKLSSGELLVGEATERMGLVAAIKSSKAGGVTMADAMAAKAQLSTPDGWEIPLYKIKKLTEIYRLLEVEKKEDEDFSLIVDGLSTELAESEYDAGDRREKWFDEVGRKGVNLIRRVLGQGEDVDKENARRRAIEEARGTNIRQLAAKYALKFNQRPEEVEMALKQLSLDNANSKQMFEFHDEDDEIGKNIRFLGYGLPSVSPQALVNKDVFDKAIAAHPDMSQNVKDALERQRVNYLQERFVDYNKLLSRTSVADEWNKALITGRATGVEDYRILEAFVADEDNYNEFKERLSGLGASIWHGFGQVIHAIPAALGAQVSKDYLASVAQKNSDRRQLAEVFGEEFGFLQDVGETAFPMLIDVGLTALLAAGTAPAGGAGAVAYASMKAGGRASASLAGKGVTKALFSSVFRRKAGKSITEQADELLGEGLIKGTRSGAVDILKTYNGKLASKLGIAPAVFIPAATRSGSATYGAVYNQLRQNPDITEEEAHDRALGSMLLAGTFTGILTSAFSVIGKGGLEDALLKGLTYKQMNTVAKSVTNMVEGDLLEVAEKAISETMKKYAFGGVKGLLRNFRDEGVEEGIDEFVNGLVTDAALNENTPFLERLQQSWHAVVLGGTMGAGVPVAQFALRPLKPAAASGAQMGGMFDEVLESMARDLTDKGAPITAEVLSAIVSDTRRKDARLSVVPTPEEQQDILEEQSKQRLLRGAKERDEGDVPLASGVTFGEKFSQELEASVNPDSVAEAVAETLASSVPVVSGADPNTVETKGSLMRSLGMQVREASSVENTDHQSVRDLLIPPVAGTEPDYFEGARPLARQLILDPARQSEVDAIEAYYTERIEKVNEAEAFYNKMDREAQSFEMSAGAESPVRKGLRRAVREGKAISSKDAAELRGLVFKDRILALRKLKIEQSVEQETQDLQELSEPVESSVNFLINSGFQHIVTIPKLKRLGIPVNQRTTSEPFLRAVNRRIAREVEEKFPKLKITKPANGAAIKSVYGQGQVFVDQNQVGQFDNDPVAMLTLLELGTPIVVSEEALASPTLNPAFRFTQVGETTVVSNIMVPESRGLVSALTPAERALNIRPDYTSLSELVNTVTSLRRQGIQNPNDLISSPFNPDEKITVEEAMSRLEQSADVTEFLQPTRRGLTEPFAATAAIELRLRAQEALFRGDTVSLEGLGNQVANRYQQEQEARLKHQKEVFMSTVSPENAAELQADPDFNPESEISDTYTAYPEEDPVLFSPSELSGLFKDAQSNAVAAITGDQELRTRVVNLVQNEVFGSTTIDFDRVSNKTLWGYLVQWMAQGNSRSNPASIEFQKELKGNRFDMGRPVRDTLRMMTLSSNSIEGTIQDNAEYRAFLKDQIRSLRGVEATDGQVTEFFNFIRQSIGELQLRSQPTAMSLAEVQRVNLEAIAALGLKSGESSSIIEALRRIAGVSARTQKKYDKNLVALARLLLKSPDFINTIELTIDETNQNYAGNFDILNDGTPAISINISGHNPRGVADTLLHELTHAFVTNVTRKSPAQQTRQEANAIGVLEQTVRGIRERLNVRGPQLAKIGYTNNDPRVLDGLENVDEFVAHFLTSTDFQAVVKVISDQQNNFFQRAINAIVAFFNPTRTEIPQFTEIFSSVLDLSQAAIVAAGPRKKKASISMDEFVALQDEGKVNSESLSTTAADYIADKVFPATPATDSTVRKEPVTANALANKVAHDIIESQQEQVRLASNVQAATGVDPAAQQEIVARIEETISYVEGLVSPETQIEVNNELPVMAEVDPKTGVLTINPLKLAGLGLDLQQRNGGRPVPAHTRRHILAVVINEEVAHAASVSALTTTEIQEIMDSMTLADAYRAIDAYGDTSENAAKTRESMKMGWRTGDPAVRQHVVEEMLRQHAQRVTRGFTTEEDAAFLRTNPNLLQYIIRYFKSFLKKLGYYRSRGDISPQLRVAVDRMVNEIRAMESGFRVHSNFAPFDANNPASAVEKFRKQIRMNKPIERPDAGEPALASGITADVDAEYMAAVESGDTGTAQRMVDEAISRSPFNRKGARLGFYLNGVPLEPAAGVRFGRGYYVAEGADKDSITGGDVSVSPDLNMADLRLLGLEDKADQIEYRAENVVVEAKNPLKVTDPNFGLTPEEKKFVDAEIATQAAINDAYRELGIRNMRENVEKLSRTTFEEVSKIRVANDPLSFREHSNTLAVIAMLIEEGRLPYDSLSAYSGRVRAGMMDSELVVFRPNQIKSAEPVTRDADGNVIPLSQRFDPTQESILRSGITADAVSLSPIDAPLDLSGIGVTAGSRVNTAQGSEAEDSTFEAYEQQDSYVINSVSVAKYVAFQGRKNLRGRPTQVRGKDTLIYKQLKALDDRRVEMFPNTELKATVIREINSASRVSDALVKRIAQMLYVGEVEFTGTEAQMTNVRGLIDFVRGRDKTTVNAAKEWKAQTVRGVLDEMRPLADEVYDTVNAFAVDNLVHLYDSMHPVLRERAKLWYEGANRIAQDLAERYNLTLEQASTALAVLSPQKDWFQNVSLAGRVMEVVTKNKRKKYTQTMADRALQMAENATKSSDETMAEFQKRKKRGIHETKKFNEMMVGKTLGQLIKQAKEGTESETLPARYVRVFDQINHPRGYAIISPEGNRLGLQTTKNNTVAAVGWGSYKEIQKAVNALLTTDEAIHSDLLGEQHKVRNFRNNIADPANADDGTIDTHAVSALYFIPVAGADTEVAHNFASSKGEDKISSDGSIQFGINGTYALNLKAHQDAAAFINERDGTNLSTREIQSITWEQIRTLFQPEQKREKASYAKKGDKESVLDESRQIWDKTTDDGEARQLIEERFGGYGFPDWATPRELRSVVEDVAYSERVRLKRLPSGAVSRLPDTDASGDSDGVGSVGVTGLKSGVWSPAVDARDISSGEAVELLSEIRLDGTKESSRERFLAAVTSANKSLDNFELEGASIFLAEDNSAGVAVSPVTELGGGDLFVFDSREDHKNVIGILELLQAATSQRALLDSSGDTIQVATVKVKDIDNLPNIMHQTFGFAPYSRVLSEDGSETVFMGRDSFDGFYNTVLHPYEHYRGIQPVFESEELAKAHRTRRMASMGISLEREPMTTREKIFRQTEQDEPSVTLGDIIKGLPATLVSPIAGEASTNLFGTRIKENARLRVSAKALARIREEKARIAKEEPRFRKEGAFDKEELPERLRERDLPTFLGVRGISELSLRSGVQVESAKILTLDELRGLDDSVNEAVQTIETTQGRPLDEGQRASIMSGIFGAVSDLPSEFNDAGVDYSEFIELLELPLIEKGVGFDKIGGTFKKLFFGETDPTVQRFARQRDAFLRTGDKMVEEYHLKYKEAIEKDYDPDNIPWETIQTATGTTDNIDPDPDGTIADARDKAKIDIQRKYATELSDKINKIEDAYDNARATIKATEPDAGKRRQLYTEERKKKDAAITRETELNKAARGAEEELADTTYKADLKKAFAARKDKMMRDRDAALKQIQVESPDLFNVLLDLRRLTDELSVQARDLFGRHDKGVLVKFDDNLGLYVTRRYRMFSETDYVDRILSSDEEADVAIRAAAIDFMHDQFIENETRRQIAANPSISESDARAEAERVYNSRELGGQSLGYQMITEFLLSYDTETGPEDFASAFALAGMPKTKEPRSTGALRAIVKNLQGRAEIPKPLADLMGANNIPEESVDNLLYAFATVAKIASHQHFLESMRQQGIANGWLFTKKQYDDLLKEPDGYAKHAHRFRQIQNSGADSGLNPLAGLYVENDIYESILPMFQQTTRAGNDAASTVMSTSLAAAQRLTGAAMAAKTLFSLGFYLRNALGNVLFFGPAQGYFHSAKDIISGDPMSGTGMNMFSAIRRAVQGNKAETSAYLRSLEGLDVFGNEVRSEIMIRLLRGEETIDGVQAQLSDLASKASSKKTPAHARRAAADTMARLAGAMDTFYKIGYFEHELAVLRKAYKADLAEGKISEIDLKREAAEIVGDTAQSYSRALPIIKKFTGSGAGLLIAPFVRFTAEVPRIAVNTIKRGVKEIRSDNPVIRARGRRRLAGFSFVVGGLSMALPTFLRVVISGMGEEEDEAFRMSLPPYLRNHTFFIQKLDNGDIKSWDLTYLNPFSVIADPMLRTLEHSVRGEPLTAATKLLTSSFVDPYLGDQIFAGAVFDIKENRNARNDNPIWEQSDTLPLRLAKMARYLGEEAYGPRTPTKLFKAYQALGQDQQSFDNSPFGIIFNEAMPVVPKTTPPVDMFRRVVFKMRDEQTRVQRRFGELRQTAGMSEGQVARVHRDIRKSRMRINSQLSRAMKGFRGMGVSNNEMYQTMKGARYGKRRSQLLFTGFMENPVPPKNLVDALMSTEVGRERLRALMEEHANHARFLRLDDD